MFKVIIAGSRDFSDYPMLVKRCDCLLAETDTTIVIVSGGARGADTLGESYAQERGYAVRKFPADWDRFGKSAGYKRNAQMAEYADALIAFPIGESRGTHHMIRLAQAQNLKVRVI